MKEFAIIKDEPLTSKVVSMDYVRGYNDAVEKACEWLMLHDSYSKSTEQLVRELRIAMEE